jgi:hypothetical protein
MWTCTKCGEQIEDDFEVCWACGTSIDGVEDPDFLSHDTQAAAPRFPPVPPDEVPDHLVTVWSCSLPPEAAAIRLRLEAAGIPVFLADENTIAMDWLLSNAIGGIKVQVAEPDVPRACEILGIELPQDDEEIEDDVDADEDDDNQEDEEE